MRSDFSLNTYSSFEALDSTTVVQSAVVIKMKLPKDICDQERLFPHQVEVEHSHTNTSFVIPKLVLEICAFQNCVLIYSRG